MQYLFTTSSDISDGPILSFDLLTREIRISDHRSENFVAEKTPFPLDDLFDETCRHRLDRMALSDLVFLHEKFGEIIRQLTELAESDRIPLKADNTLAIEVTAENYHVVIEQNVSFRTLTRHEFVQLLIGQLNQAQFKRFYRKLLERDLACDE